MLRLAAIALCASSIIAAAQAPATPPASDPLAPMNFLLGTWSAESSPNGTAGAHASGTYTFRRDLNGHALQRTSSADTCKGPASFDCQHHDELTIFADSNGAAAHGATLFALYLDSEGHVIYYTVTTPDPHTVILLSQGRPDAPHFRLTYHLEGDGPKAVMTGKFQFAPPGSTDFHSYLEWSGTKQ